METFDPAAWAWWRQDPQMEPPVVDSPGLWVIIPDSMDDIDIHPDVGIPDPRSDVSPRILHRPEVSDVHFLRCSRPEDDWIQDLRRDAVAYLDERIRADGNPLRAEWEAVCQRHGSCNPVGRWEQYRTEHLDPVLE